MRSEESFSVQVMCMYDQRDKRFYRSLQVHLSLWQRAGYIQWLEAESGRDAEQTISGYLQRADIVLLFISPGFFAQDLCYIAMNSALQEQIRRQIPVIPVLVRASNWKESICGRLKALPDDEKPIVQWTFPEQAYENIRAGLRGFIPGLSKDRSVPINRSRLFQARDLPKDYVLRSKVFNDIKRKLLSERSGQTIALRGAGGFGKTTLALALCNDWDIQMAFLDGILWVELGEHPQRALDVLNGALASLEPSLSGALTLEEAREHWRIALHKRICLLVIDDVWQMAALSPLLEGGPLCMRLITTRNDRVLPEGTVHIWIDAMELEEAIVVLSRGISGTIQQGAYRLDLENLARQLGYWPLLLTLAHGLLADQIRYGRTIAQALEEVKRAYQHRGVTAFQLEQVNERHQTVERCLEVSLRYVEEFTLARYQAVMRYQELAIFPDDIDIPLTTLHAFWHGTGGLETWETDELCMRLHQLSLLLTCDLGSGTVRLHDVMHNYLVQRVGSRLSTLHTRFLDISKQTLILRRWIDLPPDEYYLWHYLILHLCSASNIEELKNILTDLLYLTRKVLYVGVSGLEADLLQASAFGSIEPISSERSFFASLHRTIVGISHLLRHVTTQAEVGGLLLSYLRWQDPFIAQSLAFESWLARPFIVAWHPLPGGSSSALLRTMRGHTNWVNGCAVSPDGSYIVSASWDQTLKVWDAATGAERLTLRDHVSEIRGCAVSPNGKYIVSASNDRTLKIWDAATGVERLTLRGHKGEIRGCVVSPDGSYIVSASQDQTLKIWDAATGAERLTLRGHTGELRGCAVSPDGSYIVSASDDHTLKVWDVTTGAERLTLRGHTSIIRSCAVSVHGQFIVSGSNDQTLKVWDAATGADHLTLRGHTSTVRGCAVSPDGSYIVSASDDHTLKVWDAATGAERFTLLGHTDEVNGCAVSPDGSYIVSASDDHTLKVWDAATGAERSPSIGHTSTVRGCIVSPDGSYIVSASNDQTLKVWDAIMGVESLTLIGHTSMVRGCVVSPDGRSIISCSNDQTLKVWDAITGMERQTLIGHTNWVVGCAVSPDGSYIVSASYDHTLKVWDATTGVERLTLMGHLKTVRGCAVSPDGSYIVSASDDHTLKVWDATTGVERYSLIGHTSTVRGCAVSPDGSYIVSASDDHTLKVWNATTGVEQLTLIGHAHWVTGCAVSPDGCFIISASYDQTFKVWNTQTGACLLTFPVEGALSGCAFHPDSEHLVACGAQGVYFLRLVA